MTALHHAGYCIYFFLSKPISAWSWHKEFVLFY
jgi:hypothetical protein